MFFLNAFGRQQCTSVKKFFSSTKQPTPNYLNPQPMQLLDRTAPPRLPNILRTRRNTIIRPPLAVTKTTAFVINDLSGLATSGGGQEKTTFVFRPPQRIRQRFPSTSDDLTGIITSPWRAWLLLLISKKNYWPGCWVCPFDNFSTYIWDIGPVQSHENVVGSTTSTSIFSRYIFL